MILDNGLAYYLIAADVGEPQGGLDGINAPSPPRRRFSALMLVPVMTRAKRDRENITWLPTYARNLFANASIGVTDVSRFGADVVTTD
jgi:hypothetical protein